MTTWGVQLNGKILNKEYVGKYISHVEDRLHEVLWVVVELELDSKSQTRIWIYDRYVELFLLMLNNVGFRTDL